MKDLLPPPPPVKLPSPDEWLSSLDIDGLRQVVREQSGEIYDLREALRETETGEDAYRQGVADGFWGGFMRGAAHKRGGDD